MKVAYSGLNHMLKIYREFERLYFLAWEGGHQDHDAVYVLGCVFAKKNNLLNKAFQFSLYNSKCLPFKFYNVIWPIKENGKIFCYNIRMLDRLKYLGYCFYYKSQAKTWLGLFPFYLFNMIFSGKQKLQLADYTRIRVKPHAGKLFYEKRNLYTYQQFLVDASRFIAQIE
jgi:hypothetical protein